MNSISPPNFIALNALLACVFREDYQIPYQLHLEFKDGKSIFVFKDSFQALFPNYLKPVSCEVIKLQFSHRNFSNFVRLLISHDFDCQLAPKTIVEFLHLFEYFNIENSSLMQKIVEKIDFDIFNGVISSLKTILLEPSILPIIKSFYLASLNKNLSKYRLNLEELKSTGEKEIIYTLYSQPNPDRHFILIGSIFPDIKIEFRFDSPLVEQGGVVSLISSLIYYAESVLTTEWSIININVCGVFENWEYSDSSELIETFIAQILELKDSNNINIKIEAFHLKVITLSFSTLTRIFSFKCLDSIVFSAEKILFKKESIELICKNPSHIQFLSYPKFAIYADEFENIYIKKNSNIITNWACKNILELQLDSKEAFLKFIPLIQKNQLFILSSRILFPNYISTIPWNTFLDLNISQNHIIFENFWLDKFNIYILKYPKVLVTNLILTKETFYLLDTIPLNSFKLLKEIKVYNIAQTGACVLNTTLEILTLNIFAKFISLFSNSRAQNKSLEIFGFTLVKGVDIKYPKNVAVVFNTNITE